MPELLFTSLLWAFSFGLIKEHLTGLDPSFVAFLRLAISALVFAPFLRPMPVARALRLAALGTVQFGVMYLLYIASYRHLQAFEVALFTVTTPLYVVLIDAWLTGRRSALAFVSAALAVGGALVITWKRPDADAMRVGFALVQAANVCFAVGQVWYRRWLRDDDIPHRRAMAVLYLGAVTVTGLVAAWTTDVGASLASVDRDQWWVLLYLGLLPSGLGFYLWNRGAVRVGAGTLSVLNNWKVPLGVLCSLVVFGEQADVPRLFLGAAIVAVAFGVARREEPTG